MSLGKRIPGGYVFVDGTGVGDVDRSVMRERESLGTNGIMLINLKVNKGSGKLIDTYTPFRGMEWIPSWNFTPNEHNKKHLACDQAL
jgi:mRNA degradation ribonuclease J1/J2